MKRDNSLIGVKIGQEMSVNPTESQKQATQEQPQEQKQSDKEYNFAQIRKQLEQERLARQQAEDKANQLMQERAKMEQNRVPDDDDSSDEPYVDHKSLSRKLAKLEANIEQKIDKKAQEKAQSIFEAHKREQWLKNNPDFVEVMNHAQKFADKDPELAETILEMPDTFERQKLVYKNIKALGLHKKEEPKSTIQDRVNQNQRNPYYQPSGIGTAPYASAADFSPTGQKTSYDKMKELQARLRLG